MDVPAIHAVHLTKRYGKHTVVDHLDLDIPWGKVVGLVGPNGCGKTTTMRMLAGRLKPSAGGVRIGGVEASALHKTGPRLGYMPQNGGLYPELTVQQNVAFFAAAQSIPRRDGQRADAVDAAIRRVGLDDRRRSRVGDLSGGMKRRTSMAAALVHNPEFLLLDEPTVGVDPEVRIALWDTIRDLRADGATVLVSTHYIDEATRCDEVMMMRAGRLLARAPPKQLMARTRTKSLEDAFVALLEDA